MPDDPNPPIDNEEDPTISVSGGPDGEATMSSEDAHPRHVVPELPFTVAGYRILSQLGRGGTGVVWEAEQEHPKRRVALKVLRRDHLIDDYHTKMFQREVETLARLKHPNIAAIYESGHTDDGHDFFAMELVQGETLNRWLEARPETVDAAGTRATASPLSNHVRRGPLRPPARRHPPRSQTRQYHRHQRIDVIDQRHHRRRADPPSRSSISASLGSQIPTSRSPPCRRSVPSRAPCST